MDLKILVLLVDLIVHEALGILKMFATHVELKAVGEKTFEVCNVKPGYVCLAIWHSRCLQER